MKSRTALFLFVGAGQLAAGCSGAKTSPGQEPIEHHTSMLVRMQSCDELSGALRDDAQTKMNLRIDAEVRAIRDGYSGYGYGYAVPEAANAGRAVNAAPTGASDDKAASTPAHSETETQVKGVDEADIVKADGTSIYLLHGNKLLMLDAWPAEALAVRGSADIEGEPSEMFVANGKAVVFSTVEGTPTYAAAGVTPKDSYSDNYSVGGRGGVAGGGVAIGMAATPAFSGGGVSVTHPLTKVTVLTLEQNTAQVSRELYFEGSYLSSRRVGSKVRVVLQGGAHGPVIEYNPEIEGTTSSNGVYEMPSKDAQIAAWEQLRSKNQAAIAKTSFADWTPLTMSKDAGGVHAAPTACANFYVPSTGSSEFGMTQIQSFDLDALANPPESSAIVGAVSTVYGDASSMVLAGRAYADPWAVRRGYGAPTVNGQVQSDDPVETLNFTYLHMFDLAQDPSRAQYVASGKVPGDVKDQFALDQKEGRVRVATTEQRTGPMLAGGKQNQVSHVFVLENRTGQLQVVGDAGEIAPGEQLYATRYIGDKAYVVTWHVTDPLFVIDLANPAKPTILGELKIPGFSEYMHPLDDTHLLTIGRETDDTGHQHTDGGFWYGIALQVFDVTNPLDPKQQYKYVFDGGDYATTEAAQNHKAFTYFDDKKLLAFPYVRQSGFGTSANAGPSSTLEVFKVAVDTGIQKVGSIDHAPLLATTSSGSYGYCGGYYDGAVRRGVFFENDVYSISYGGVMVNDVTHIDTPVATLKLDTPKAPGLACGVD